MIGLGVWAFIGVVWYSAYYFLVFWICGFLMLNNFWKFLVHCYFKHSFCSSLPFFSCYCNFAYVILLKLSHDCQTFWFFAVFILFSLYFSWWCLYWPVTKLSDSFFSYVKSTDELMKCTLHFSHNVVFFFSVFFYSFLELLSPYITYLFLHIGYLFQ